MSQCNLHILSSEKRPTVEISFYYMLIAFREINVHIEFAYASGIIVFVYDA